MSAWRRTISIMKSQNVEAMRATRLAGSQCWYSGRRVGIGTGGGCTMLKEGGGHASRAGRAVPAACASALKWSAVSALTATSKGGRQVQPLRLRRKTKFPGARAAAPYRAHAVRHQKDPHFFDAPEKDPQALEAFHNANQRKGPHCASLVQSAQAYTRNLHRTHLRLFGGHWLSQGGAQAIRFFSFPTKPLRCPALFFRCPALFFQRD